MLRLGLAIAFFGAIALTHNNSGATNSIRIVYGVVVAVLILGGLIFVMRRKWSGGFSDSRARTVEMPHHTPTASGAPVQYHAPAPAPSPAPATESVRAPIVPPPSSTPGLTWGGQSAPDLGTSPPTE